MPRLINSGASPRCRGRIIYFPPREVRSALELLSLVLDCLASGRLNGCRRFYQVRLWQDRWDMWYLSGFTRQQDKEEIEMRCVELWDWLEGKGPMPEPLPRTRER